MDFSITEDKIETADAYSAIAQAISGGNLMLTDSDGDTLTLLGVSSTLTEEYFLYIQDNLIPPVTRKPPDASP